MPAYALLLAMAAALAPSPASAADSADPFTAIQAKYFSLLNMRASAKRLAAIPAFSAKLTALALAQRAKFASPEAGTPEERQRAGLILIYDALLTMSNSIGVSQGSLKLAALRQAHAFGPASGDDKAEMTARAQHAIDDLELAFKLRPDDHRLDSWLAATRIQKEKAAAGKLSDKVLADSLDAIPVRPTFNLWTAILLFRDQPADSALFARLAGEAKGFVDKIKSGDDPCRNKPEDCTNTPIAPYNTQAAVVELGDVFLRRAEVLLQAGDIPHAMEMAGYAAGSYAQLKTPEHAASSKAWPDAVAVADRLDRVAAIQKGHAASPLLDRTANYRRPYECASCHGR